MSKQGFKLAKKYFSLTGFLGAFIFLLLQGCTSNVGPGHVPVEDRSAQAGSRQDVGGDARADRSVSTTDFGQESGGSKVYPRSGRSQEYSPQGSTPLVEEKLTLQFEKDYQSGSALASLLKDADLKVSEGSLNVASSLLERALRIEPKNALVWHKLAGVRYEQKSWKLAESLALKSNLFSVNDTTLQMYNWHLIASVRNKSGDISGARKATFEAEQIAAKR